MNWWKTCFAVCLILGLVHVASEGFLEDELPLEIVATTPSRLTRDTTTPVRGTQTITVVFSRPVIALGADFGEEQVPDDLVPFTLDPPVNGRLRWVTTYIARFDPEEEWPYDFEIDLKWNLKLESFDGARLSLSSPRTTMLTTPSNSMQIRTIVSETANNITDNNWDPNIGLRSDILPELVKDGVIELSFIVPVNLQVLYDDLRIREVIPAPSNCTKEGSESCVSSTKPTGLFANVKSCVPGLRLQDSEDSKCANVTIIAGRIKDNTKYELFLPVGSNYSTKHGSLKTEMVVEFGGLRPFKLPFLEDRQRPIRSKYLDIWLPHGTGDEQTIDDIPINITNLKTEDEISFTREEISASVFRLTADLAPGNKYRIKTFNSTVARDDYGQVLIETELEFRTSNFTRQFRIMTPGSYRNLALFEKSQDWTSQILMFTKGGGKSKNQCNAFDVWSVLEAESLALVASNGNYYDPGFDLILGDSDDRLSPDFEDSSGEISTFPVSDYLSESGVLALQQCYNPKERPNYDDQRDDRLILLESDYNAIAYLFHELDDRSTVLVFVSELSTGAPVSDVDVHWYTVGGRSRQPKATLVGINSTDESGLARIQTESWTDDAVIEIEADGRLLHVPVLYAWTPSETSTLDALILDRKMIRPGETLYSKGFVMQRTGPVLQHPTGSEYFLEIYPSIDGVGDSSRLPVEVSPDFSSYNVSIEIPQNASLRDYSIALRNRRRSGSDFYGTSESFTVGEPRSPTVELSINGSDWAPPTGSISIEIEATSFIGASVGDQEIKIEWRAPIEGEDEPIEGETSIITDSEGRGEFELDLTSLESTLSVGSTVQFTVQWIGPTGELIEERLSTEIAFEDLKIELSRTVETEIPLQNFGVSVDLTNLNGGRKLSRNLQIKTAEINLKEVNDVEIVPTDDYGPLTTASVQTCTFEVNGAELCEFQLPSTGLFALEACVETPTRTLCSWETLGRSQESWKSSPLSNFIPLGFQRQPGSNGGSFKAGDKLEVLIDNPYTGAKAVMVWGNLEGVEYKVQDLSDDQRSILSFELDDRCRFTCRFGITVVIPRQIEGLGMILDLPVSSLFDPAMPHTEDWETSIRTQTSDEEIEIKMEFPEATEQDDEIVIGPGDSTEISISLDVEDPIEVTVIAVDKAILELISNPLVSLTNAFTFTLTSTFDVSASSEYIIAPGALQALIERFEFAKDLDPWFEIDNELVKEPSSNIDETREQYIERSSIYITIHPDEAYSGHYYASYYNYADSEYAVALAAAITAPESESNALSKEVQDNSLVARSASSVSAEQEVDSIRSETAFLANAFFSVQVIKSGKGVFDFIAPDNLGTFVIRAYAASGTGVFGSQEAELIVRRTLSLTPSMPRFVRVGDIFESGAVITSSGAIPDPVVFEVETLGPVELKGRARQKVRLGSDQQQEAQFQFEVLSLGTVNFTFSVRDQDGNQDSVELSLEILGLQEEVVLGTSFILQSNSENSTSSEGLDLPEAVPGSGTVSITAGVGQQPALIALTEQIQDSDPEFICPYDYETVLAASVIPAVLNPYNLWSEHSADELKGVLESILSRFEKSVELLSIGGESLTNRRLGLISHLPCPKDLPFPSSRSPSLFINARGLWLFNQLESNLEGHEEEIVREGYEALMEAKEVWKRVHERALINEARRSRTRFNTSIDLSTLALSRAVLGNQWTPNNVSAEIQEDLSSERLSSEFNDLTLSSQAYYILSLFQDSDDDSELISDESIRAVEHWTSLYRVTGRTAYIAASEEASQPASNLANALILLALIRIGTEDQLLPKLATYVAAPMADYYGFTQFTNYDKTVAMTALMYYDLSRNSTQPDVSLTAQSGDSEILQEAFNETSPAIVSRTLDWEDLEGDQGSLLFTVEGNDGEVNIALTLNFIPLELLPFPSYRGIFVERVITVEEDGGRGVQTVPVGSTVFVKVQFMTPDRLPETVVRVLMPAGLEPVDPNIFGGQDYCPVPFFSFFYRSTCPEQETTPSVVTFTFPYVRSGTNSVQFRAVAATVGIFALPPARVFVSDQPEVMGLSSAGSFEVCQGSCEVQYLEEESELQSCPEDCNGNGSCNVQDGSCNCFRGFSGLSCDIPTQ